MLTRISSVHGMDVEVGHVRQIFCGSRPEPISYASCRGFAKKKHRTFVAPNCQVLLECCFSAARRRCGKLGVVDA